MGKFFILVTVLGFLNILGNLAYTMSLVAYIIYNTYFVKVQYMMTPRITSQTMAIT